ncbi:hypothetical protein FOA52_006642 [Chlamydomonas sp. UWO 241]|nr:hypothetical protein FOA52_006642 [Chlamydomonas sp. UWO 241]
MAAFKTRGGGLAGGRRAAAIAALDAPTPILTLSHAIVLTVDYEPSLPLKFKVSSYEVKSKADLNENLRHLGGLPQQPPMAAGCTPDRVALMVIMVGKSILRLMPCGIDEQAAADVRSGRREGFSTAEYINMMNMAATQEKMRSIPS